MISEETRERFAARVDNSDGQHLGQLETLEQTKAKAVEVGLALEQAATISIDVERQRNTYRLAARLVASPPT